MAYESRIANELLVTPFDDKSMVSAEVSEKLTEEEFCEHCYSLPVFEQINKQYMGEDFNYEDSDLPTKYIEIENQIHQQSESYNNFQLWLNNFKNRKVYTINGNAGTGKTTFINYKKYKETNINWIILDIHLARSFDEWMSDIRTDIDHFEQAQAKVYGSIMNLIWKLLFQGLDENENYSLKVVYSNLVTLTDNYKNKFVQLYPSGRKLLDQVCKVMEGEQNQVFKIEESAKLFKQYIDGRIGTNSEGIINVLNILLLVLRCLETGFEKKYIIVFDNFERFIEKDELYNKDVDNVRLVLTSYVNKINEKGNCHRNYFKFAMTIRDSTARMCGVRLQASDAQASNLDLGNWYDTQDIIYLKKQWYKDNNIKVENSDIVEQITGDLRVFRNQIITGLELFIDPLFNNNKRLIIDFIGSMVELPGNAKNIEMYLNLWKENTSHSRFAARSIIRGMILDELEKKPDKLFEHLKTYSTSVNDNGIGDARKILTILHNNIQNGHENEMPLTAVLAELFHTFNIETIWNDPKYAKKRHTISEILFYMNSYNRRDNDWIQFIDLQFKNSNYDVIAKDADGLEEIISKNMKNCTLHLLPAGRAYLMYIVASFEFFSLRYVKNYVPLFTLIPTPEEISKPISVKELPCYIKIQGVATSAGRCIELLQQKEDSIKILMDKSAKGAYHYTRIINQHKSYINSFNTFVRNKYCESKEIDERTRRKYETLCREIMIQSNSYNKYESSMYKQKGR